MNEFFYGLFEFCNSQPESVPTGAGVVVVVVGISVVGAVVNGVGVVVGDVARHAEDR